MKVFTKLLSFMAKLVKCNRVRLALSIVDVSANELISAGWQEVHVLHLHKPASYNSGCKVCVYIYSHACKQLCITCRYPPPRLIYHPAVVYISVSASVSVCTCVCVCVCVCMCVFASEDYKRYGRECVGISWTKRKY